MKALLALAASLLVAAPAIAADNTVASLNWRLDFSASSVEAGYGLSLGYRGAEQFAPLSRIVELKVDRASVSATLAGFALAARSYQANQTAADQAYDAGVDTRPWYAHAWVYWTVAGVGAATALAGAAGSGSGGAGEGNSTPSCEDSGGCGINCTNGSCTVPCVNFPQCIAPGFRRLRQEDRLEERELTGSDPAGGMGDLLPVQP